MEAHQFQDSEGRTWSMNLTIGTYLKLKSDLGIDVNAFLSEDAGELRDLVIRKDIEKLINIIEIVLGPQLAATGVATEDFYASMDSSVFEAATIAMVEGIVNFSPVHLRPALRATLEAVDRGLTRAGEKVMQKIPEMEAKMDLEVDKAMSTSGSSTDTSGTAPE